MSAGDRLTPEQEEQLGRYRAGALPAAEREAFEREVLADPDLAEALYSELSLDAVATARPGRVVPLHGGMPPRAWAAVAAVAAVLVLAVLLPRAWRSAPSPGPDAMRGSGGGVALLSPVGEVPESPHGFRWRAVAGAADYRLEWFDAAGARLGTRLVADTALVPGGPLPAAGEWALTPLTPEGLPAAAPARARWSSRRR